MASRPRAWADTRFAIPTLVAGTPQSFDLLAGAPTVDMLTVTRIIGDFKVMYSPNLTIVDSLSIVDVGIGVVSRDAFTVAGTAMPSPNTVLDFPTRGWLYVATQAVSQQAESAGVVNEQAHFKFDLRAMRKIDKGVLFITLLQADILVGGSMRVVGRVRSLCLA